MRQMEAVRKDRPHPRSLAVMARVEADASKSWETSLTRDTGMVRTTAEKARK